VTIINTCTHTHTCTCTRARARTQTHTHTLTHTHTPMMRDNQVITLRENKEVNLQLREYASCCMCHTCVTHVSRMCHASRVYASGCMCHASLKLQARTSASPANVVRVYHDDRVFKVKVLHKDRVFEMNVSHALCVQPFDVHACI